MCIAVRTFHWKKRIIDFEIIENEEPSSVIAAVYAGEPSTGTAGNNVVVFDRKFNVVFELKDMRYYYTSVFKRTGMMFNAPNTVNIAFTAINSTHVHLMTINITVYIYICTILYCSAAIRTKGVIRLFPLSRAPKCTKTFSNSAIRYVRVRIMYTLVIE